MTLGERIKNERRKQGLNQTQLAEKADILRSTLCLIESGKRENTSVWIILKISGALKISVEELAGLREKQQPSPYSQP